MRWEGRVRWTDGRADGFGRAAVCGGFWAFSVGFCWGSGGRWREWGRPLSREPPAGLPGHRERAHDLPFPRACGGHVAVRARGLWGGVGGWDCGVGGFRASVRRAAGRVSLRLQLRIHRRFALFPPAAVWRLWARRSRDDPLPCDGSLCVRCFHVCLLKKRDIFFVCILVWFGYVSGSSARKLEQTKKIIL
jgi:hypothetical protein